MWCQWHQRGENLSYRTILVPMQGAQWNAYPKVELYPWIGRSQNERNGQIFWCASIQILLQHLHENHGMRNLLFSEVAINEIGQCGI